MIYYVNASAERDGDGSQGRPFRHVNDAAQIARPGDEVVVAPGIYREYVNPRFAGTEENRIIYRSEVKGAARITGAEKLGGWTRFRGNVWTARVRNSLFGEWNH